MPNTGWSEASESKGDSNDGEAMPCFMVIEANKNKDSGNYENNEDLSYDDYLPRFKNSIRTWRCSVKNNNLKRDLQLF